MLLRMAGIKNSTNNKCWRRGGERVTLLHCWWKWKLVQPLWKTVWRFLKKLEIELPYDPAIPLLGIRTEETRIERDTCTPMFIAALFIIARTWKQPLECEVKWDLGSIITNKASRGDGIPAELFLSLNDDADAVKVLS